MLTGYRFRLYPTPRQEQVLLRWIGCQRLIYHAKVREDRYFRRFAQRLVGTAGMPIPVDQAYSHFITDQAAFLREAPSPVLRNGAVKFRQAYQRFFQKRGNRPKLKKKTERQSVWLTRDVFRWRLQADPVTGERTGYQLDVGTPPASARRDPVSGPSAARHARVHPHCGRQWSMVAVVCRRGSHGDDPRADIRRRHGADRGGLPSPVRRTARRADARRRSRGRQTPDDIRWAGVRSAAGSKDPAEESATAT